MLTVHVGHSLLPDSREAAVDAIEQVERSLCAAPASACLLLLSSDHDPAPIVAAIRDAFDGIEVAGCTTSGELTSIEGFCEGSVVLTVFSADNVEIKAGVGGNVSLDPAKASADAVRMAMNGTTRPPTLCLAFPDGLTSNCTDVIAGIQSVLGHNFPIFGGAAADDWKFEKTAQICGNEVVSDSVAVLLFCGDVDFAFGCAHGWSPFTKRVEVTHSEGNVVYSIDDRPALDFYRHYMGNSASLMIVTQYPLAVFTDRESDDFYLRAGLSFDADNGSIMYAGDVPKSSWVQISKTSRESIISGCTESLTSAASGFPETSPQAALIFSCAARKEQLGTRTPLEFDALQRQFGSGVPTAGFYCYAEIAPLLRDKPTYVHNQTFITLLLGS